jgi:hypothetical protein
MVSSASLTDTPSHLTCGVPQVVLFYARVAYLAPSFISDVLIRLEHADARH